MTLVPASGYSLQPIVDLASGTVLYSEMLVRFADGRNVQSEILQAETQRRIHEIDFWVLEQAVDVIERTGTAVAVNVSPITIEQCLIDLIDMVRGYGRLTHHLVLEVTETAPILQPSLITSFALRMQRLGVRVALDDYGSGFCDAARALFVRADFIKVPKAGRNGWSSMMEREWSALQDFAGSSRSRLVGEGVETEADLQQVRSMGFHGGQGFHFSDAHDIHPPSARSRILQRIPRPA